MVSYVQGIVKNLWRGLSWPPMYHALVGDTVYELEVFIPFVFCQSFVGCLCARYRISHWSHAVSYLRRWSNARNMHSGCAVGQMTQQWMWRPQKTKQPHKAKNIPETFFLQPPTLKPSIIQATLSFASLTYLHTPPCRPPCLFPFLMSIKDYAGWHFQQEEDTLSVTSNPF